MSFHLRPATPADRAWLFALRRATMRDYVLQTWHTWDDTTQRELFEQAFALTDLSIIVAHDAPKGGSSEHHDADAGLLQVDRDTDDLYLANLQIHPSFQNRGLGTAVVASLLAEAQAARHPVRLQVLRVNTSARRLYSRLGFTVTSQTPTHTLMHWLPS